jgi:hypothetical protein
MAYCAINQDLLEKLRLDSKNEDVRKRAFFAPKHCRTIPTRGSVLLAYERMMTLGEARQGIAKFLKR